MRQIPVVVIGAGQCGLAASHELTARAIEHVVLERGTVANTWRTERWDSLRLLTPNWQSRLPGQAYDGPDPDGFMTMPEVIAFLDAYARRVGAPVQTGTTVTAVRRDGDGFVVEAETGAGPESWSARAVVVASGAFNLPNVPPLADRLPPSVTALAASAYRNPVQLPAGGVLVVGASATGIQLADEIHRSGRPVTIAVGEHVRVPRRYRGVDVQRWMDRTGLHDQRYDEVDDAERVRRLPSMQLVGAADREIVDLNELRRLGVVTVGRLVAVDGPVARFSGSLRNVCALADLKLGRLLDGFDLWAVEAGIDRDLVPAHRFPPTEVDASPLLQLDLEQADVRTVVWATGWRPDHSWLQLDVLDRKGRLRHEGGVTPEPGLYRLGLPFLRRRKSSLIDGAGADAAELCQHLAGHLAGALR